MWNFHVEAPYARCGLRAATFEHCDIARMGFFCLHPED